MNAAEASGASRLTAQRAILCATRRVFVALSLTVLILIAVSGTFVGMRIAAHSLPYDRLAERFDFATPGDARANSFDPGKASGYKSAWEFCEIAAALLLANTPDARHRTLGDAFLPWLPPRFGGDYCLSLHLQLEGEWNGEVDRLKMQYLWGEIAVYGLALMLVDRDVLYYLTWLLTVGLLTGLAFVVIRLGSERARLALLPVVALAVVAGANYYWSDVVNGVPYVFALATLLAAALLFAVGRLRPVAPYFIFGVGCVSAHVWQNDGHNYLLAVMLPTLAYFLNEDGGRGRRVAYGVSRLLIYCAGFFATFAMMIAAKGVAVVQYLGGDWNVPMRTVLGNGKMRFREASVEAPYEQFGAGLDRLPFFRELPLWWDMAYLPIPAMLALTLTTILAAALVLWLLSRQRPLPASAWDAALCLLAAGLSMTAFLVDDDDPYRSSRFMFMWHGLLWGAALVGGSILWQTDGAGPARRIMRRLIGPDTFLGGFFTRARPLRVTLLAGVFVLLAIAALAVPLLRGPEDNPRYFSPPASGATVHRSDVV